MPPAPLPPRCEKAGWEQGCLYREEPNVWLRWGATDAAVRKTVVKDYWGMLLQLVNGTRDASNDPNAGVRVVLDAGANVGLATRLFAGFFGSNTTVVALEAQRNNHALARLNNANSAQALVLHAALGPPGGDHWLTIRAPPVAHGHEYGFVAMATSTARTATAGGASEGEAPESEDEPSAGESTIGKEERVRKVRVRQLLHALCLPSVDFLKLDIEGGEAPLLQAANTSSRAPFEAHGELEWLTHVKYAVVEVHEARLPGADPREKRVQSLAVRALRGAGMTVLQTSVRGEAGLIACGAMLPVNRCAQLCDGLMAFDSRVNGAHGRFRCGASKE